MGILVCKMILDLLFFSVLSHQSSLYLMVTVPEVCILTLNTAVVIGLDFSSDLELAQFLQKIVSRLALTKM
jgi:hypothetical protein